MNDKGNTMNTSRKYLVRTAVTALTTTAVAFGAGLLAAPTASATTALPAATVAMACDGYTGSEVTRPGDTGRRVQEIQCLLTQCGYEVLTDGIFGSGLRSVVMRFQLGHGLPPDGVVAPATWQALRSC
jgi:peptidoglycan hydrolase-like protein with peptidoglycan-binding domain